MPLTVGAIAAPIIGGFMGQQASADAANAALQARKDALAQFGNVHIPTIESMTISPENYLSSGSLTPEMQQALGLGDTSLAGVSTDPRLKSDQMSALAQISQLAQGNPQAGDLAGFQLARQNAAGELNAQNNKVLQDMQQRGQAGSGAELLAKLTNNQNSAQMLSNQDLEQAKAMQAARMQALQSQSSLATNIRGQDYGEAAQMANARDAIAKYNAQNSQAVSNANVAAKNTANATNLSNAQNISNANTTTHNQAEQYNKQLNQQNYNNQFGLANAKAGQYNTNAGASQTQAGQTAGQYATIGQGIGQILQGANKQKVDAYGNPVT